MFLLQKKCVVFEVITSKPELNQLMEFLQEMVTVVRMILQLEFRQSGLRLIFSELFRKLQSESNKSDCSRVNKFL